RTLATFGSKLISGELVKNSEPSKPLMEMPTPLNPIIEPKVITTAFTRMITMPRMYSTRIKPGERIRLKPKSVSVRRKAPGWAGWLVVLAMALPRVLVLRLLHGAQTLLLARIDGLHGLRGADQGDRDFQVDAGQGQHRHRDQHDRRNSQDEDQQAEAQRLAGEEHAHRAQQRQSRSHTNDHEEHHVQHLSHARGDVAAEAEIKKCAEEGAALRVLIYRVARIFASELRARGEVHARACLRRCNAVVLGTATVFLRIVVHALALQKGLIGLPGLLRCQLARGAGREVGRLFLGIIHVYS